MGMYDTVMVPCPKCGKKSGFQSKSGPCLLNDFELEDVPADVIEDVMRHGPATCGSCGTIYGVRYTVVSKVDAKSVEWSPDIEEDENEDPCPGCDGTGSGSDHSGDPCKDCNGTGANESR